MGRLKELLYMPPVGDFAILGSCSAATTVNQGGCPYHRALLLLLLHCTCFTAGGCNRGDVKTEEGGL